MQKARNELILIGDRVLIAPEEGERQTKAGLYLPATVLERDKVGGGRVVQVGPGYLMPNPEFSDEPWARQTAVRYLPLQAQVGDFAFYLRKEAIELTFEEQNYLIVPHAALLALVRPQTEDDILENLNGIEDLFK